VSATRMTDTTTITPNATLVAPQDYPRVRYGTLDGFPVVCVGLVGGGGDATMTLDAADWTSVVKRWGASWTLVRGPTMRTSFVRRTQDGREDSDCPTVQATDQRTTR